MLSPLGASLLGNADYSHIDCSDYFGISFSLQLPAILSFVFSLGSCPSSWRAGKLRTDLNNALVTAAVRKE